MQLKKYAFPFTVLDDSGHERRMRTADDDDVAELLQDQIGSPSEHIHQLILAEQDRFEKITYSTALERVRKRNPKLFRIYASECGGKLRIYAGAG